MGDALYKADRYDVDVDVAKCMVYPCPLAIKIYSPDFIETSYNGYYVLNFPATYNDFLTKDSTNYIPSYKHLSRNLYLYADFKSLIPCYDTKTARPSTADPVKCDETNVGHYLIANMPSDKYCNEHSVRIAVKHPVKYTLGSMGQRYCFSKGTFIRLDHLARDTSTTFI